MKILLQKGFRYSAPEGCVDMIEHLSESPDAGATWCGPVIPSETHPRGGEISEPLVCIACGAFLPAGASTVATVRRVDRTAEERARLRALARGFGLTEGQARALERPNPRPRVRTMRQIELFQK